MPQFDRPLAGRVAIVTGAGRGLGRCHALKLAEDGAAVVVNDLGGSVSGDGSDLSPAQLVVEEIRAASGQAIVSAHDASDWNQAEQMVHLAINTFGDLHVLVNNAGILRDRTLANLSEGEWDDVIRVHLKGHAAPTHHAMAYWRGQSKTGHDVKASVVCTTSIAGFAGNYGQASYSTAKAGLVAFSRVVALEGERYGVRANAVSPSARTRLETSLKPPATGVFDTFDPANVSPLIAWLARADCPASSQIFQIYGNRLKVLSMATIVHDLRTESRWTTTQIDEALRSCLIEPCSLSYYVDEIDQ
jgi:NAD(P)-dependent dehydrogenase (short-subunit alcohol dehydrogenase family)